jgi:hypothetical protein
MYILSIVLVRVLSWYQSLRDKDDDPYQSSLYLASDHPADMYMNYLPDKQSHSHKSLRGEYDDRLTLHSI